MSELEVLNQIIDEFHFEFREYSVNQLLSRGNTVFHKDKIVLLNLRSLGLTQIPESISELKHLERLNLRENRLETLPDNI